MIINRFLDRFRSGPSCAEVMEVLQSYLDGEVDTDTARDVAGHLETCPDCEVESETYRRIKSTLASRAEPIDPEVMASLLAFSDRLVTGELDGST